MPLTQCNEIRYVRKEIEESSGFILDYSSIYIYSLQTRRAKGDVAGEQTREAASTLTEEGPTEWMTEWIVLR